jgi:hypothetical protein
MGSTVILSAQCCGCTSNFEVRVDAEARRLRKAHEGNRLVWMQSHAETSGHPRFEITDARVWHVINRIGATRAQLELSDDPNYSEIEIRSCTPAPPDAVAP